MKFLAWLDAELASLDRMDAIERGDLPPGPVQFTKADGSTFYEFAQFSKGNPDGSRTTVIANQGGLAMLEAEGANVEALAAAVNQTVGAVNELSKRVSALDDAQAEAQADMVEISPADLARLFSEAVDEAGSG